MIIPVGNKKSQTLKIIKKNSSDSFTTQEEPYFAFVPLIGKEGWKEG